MFASIPRAAQWVALSCALASCAPEPQSPAGSNPDAGEGARAKMEEGRVGKMEARVERAKGDKIEVKKLEIDRQVMENAGVLGALGDGDIGHGAVGKGSGDGFGYGARQAKDLPTTESYADAGVNVWIDAATDRVSTFSIDVDTASYAISRRKLNEGQLPPTAAVRVEEFVNSLRYGYAPPADDALFRVHAELAPHPFAPDHHVLRVGLAAKEVATARQRPVHLTFLVDTSGSMTSSDKLALAQRALHYLVDNLQPADTVAIATYAGDTRKVLDPTPARRAEAIHAAIDALRSGGGTAMNSGMALAYGMASESFVRGDENRVIVLSDGDANIGPSTHGEILETVRGYAGRGITLSTVGFGMGNYKDSTMEQLADKGDGNYAYVDSMSEAKKVFGADLAGTIRTVARDVKIQVDFDPSKVRSYRLVGYENRDIADRDFRNDAVDAGEVGSGHQVTAVYEIITAGAASGPLATVRLRAKPPGADAAAAEWAVAAPGSRAAAFDAASADLRMAFGMATFAELMRGSPHTAGATYADVARIVGGAADSDRADHAELLGLIRRAEALAHSSLADSR